MFMTIFIFRFSFALHYTISPYIFSFHFAQLHTTVRDFRPMLVPGFVATRLMQMQKRIKRSTNEHGPQSKPQPEAAAATAATVTTTATGSGRQKLPARQKFWQMLQLKLENAHCEIQCASFMTCMCLHSVQQAWQQEGQGRQRSILALCLGKC